MEPHKRLPAVGYISKVIYYIYTHLEYMPEPKHKIVDILVLFIMDILLFIHYA